jgi:VanZ family protein
VRQDSTHPFLLWTPPLAWAVLIFAGSARPSVPLPGIPGIDLAAHAGEYFVLGLLLARPLARHLRGQSPFRVWTATVLLCLLYAVTDEAHQAFVPGRFCDPLDAAADAGGTILAALVAAMAFPRALRDRLGLP